MSGVEGTALLALGVFFGLSVGRLFGFFIRRDVSSRASCA